MRQVQVLLTCDACQAWKGVEVSEGVTTVPVSAGQTLDLCPEHVLATRRVWELVAEWGVSPNGGKRKAARRSASAVSGAPSAEALAEWAEGPTAPGTAATAPKNRRGGKRARARRGNATAAPTAAPGSFACPLCDATPASAHAVTIHLRARHNTTGSEVYGGTCPVCNHDGAAGGLGSHGRTAHGVASVHALFAMATAAGDPHGVIASRAQAFGQAANV